MVFTFEWFLEETIESWSQWDFNPRQLNSIQTLQQIELLGHEFISHSFRPLLSLSIATLILIKICASNHMSIAGYKFNIYI